jgi:hypothetical protein
MWEFNEPQHCTFHRTPQPIKYIQLLKASTMYNVSESLWDRRKWSSIVDVFSIECTLDVRSKYKEIPMNCTNTYLYLHVRMNEFETTCHISTIRLDCPLRSPSHVHSEREYISRFKRYDDFRDVLLRHRSCCFLFKMILKIKRALLQH